MFYGLDLLQFLTLSALGYSVVLVFTKMKIKTITSLSKNGFKYQKFTKVILEQYKKY